MIFRAKRMKQKLFILQVYAIGSFIPEHPGGVLIRRAIGEDATEHLGIYV